MKVALDPSSLVWDQTFLNNWEYIEIASTVVELLEWLDVVPVQVLMPEDMDNLYGDFPYATKDFHPHVRHVSQLFLDFITRNHNRISTVSLCDEPVNLTPDIIPARLAPEIGAGLRQFFGTLAIMVNHETEDVRILSGSQRAYANIGNQLLVAVVSLRIVVGIPVLSNVAVCRSIECQLDWRPDTVKCVHSIFQRKYASLVPGGLRPFRFSPTIEKQLDHMMYADEAKFWEVIECMARWAAGMVSGLNPHKIGDAKGVGTGLVDDIYRLDVRHGSGDKVHAIYAEDGVIEFLVYQDEHNRYKINKLG